METTVATPRRTNLGCLFQAMEQMSEAEIRAVGQGINWASMEVNQNQAVLPMESLLREASPEVRQILLPLALTTRTVVLDQQIVAAASALKVGARVAAGRLDGDSLEQILQAGGTREATDALLQEAMDRLGEETTSEKNGKQIQRCLEVIGKFGEKNRQEGAGRQEAGETMAELKRKLLGINLSKMQKSGERAKAKGWVRYWLNHMQKCDTTNLHQAIMTEVDPEILEGIWNRLPDVQAYDQGRITKEEYHQSLGGKLYRERVMIRIWNVLNNERRTFLQAVTKEERQGRAEGAGPEAEAKEKSKEAGWAFEQLATWEIKRLGEFDLGDGELVAEALVLPKAGKGQGAMEQRLLGLLEAGRVKVRVRELVAAFSQDNDTWLQARMQQAIEWQTPVTGLLGSLASSIRVLGEGMNPAVLERVSKYWRELNLAEAGCNTMTVEEFARQASLPERERAFLALQIEHQAKIVKSEEMPTKAPRL